MPPITRQLAQHLARVTYADLPAATVRAAKRSLLDAIGVSLGASGLEAACAPFSELAAQAPGPCQVLGYGARAMPLMAACANGALAHALDYEDAYDGTPAHPNAACVPVVLALAERDASIDGQSVLLALAAGCDVVCRLALALEQNPDRHGFYPPPILGAFGAAASAAKLLGLDEERIVAAFGLTLSQAMCSSQFKHDADSSLRAVRDAFAAHAGLLAAELAARNVRAFEAAFEGEFGMYALFARGAYEPERLLAGLGTQFLGERVSYKPWPSCRGTHAFVEAALRMHEQHGVSPDDIAMVVARGSALQRMLAEPLARKQAPRTAIDAKFSVPYCVALALSRGAVTLDGFSPETLGDPRVIELARRVSFVADSDSDLRDGVSGSLELHVHTGQIHRLRIDPPLGHPDQPLDDAQLVAKFVDCAQRAARPLGADAARAAATALFRLEQVASARDSFALLG